ncbi:MAG: DUF2384 domain-containing protein [Cyclobacteriaceae bacterium]|nr:DUF2384 domain-containing protein [Cyclobacteriaceae bacterium]
MSTKQKKAPIPYPKLDDACFNSVAEMQAVYQTPFSFAQIARAGVTTSFIFDLMNLLGLKKQETASLIDISTKTFDRHLKTAKPFTGLQSDRILELAELHQKGEQVFGNNAKFLLWLNSPIAVLNNTAPREWLDTQQGIKIIMTELGRIEHGIFA